MIILKVKSVGEKKKKKTEKRYEVIAVVNFWHDPQLLHEIIGFEFILNGLDK